MIEPIRLPRPEKSLDEPEVRELTPEEIKTIEADFHLAGVSLPDPAVATAFGAIVDGKIVGYIFAQLKMHIEPVKIDKGYSHLFSAIIRKTEEVLYSRCGSIWTYAFVNPGRMAALAESRGMTVEPWCVMSKKIGPRDLPVVELLDSPLEDMPAEGGVQ